MNRGPAGGWAVTGVCDGLGEPASVAEALAMLDRALDHLNATDATSLPAAVQVEALRALGRAESKHTAARARVLAAFAGQAAYEDDGQGSARSWLRWQTRITQRAASGAVGWARRLAAHPVIGDAMAAGELSESWGKQVCAWTDRLPQGHQDDADKILTAAAQEGADLAGLAGLAQEMYERTHHDRDQESGLADRGLWLGTTIGGAGRVTGDLTPGCSAALTTVLESLGTRSGPDDIRSVAQRRHDALEQACQRLIASGMLPGHAGKPAAVQVHMTLSQLRGLPGAPEAEAAWAAARAAQPGWLSGPEAEATACDGSVAPVVTGCVDWAALDRLTGFYLATHGPEAPGSARAPLSPATVARLRQTMLRLAADVLSGPGGLASALRTTGLAGGPGAGPSAPLAIPLPLDTGDAAPAIPPALRRAVLARHVTCCFPGCGVSAAQCHIHHFVPRSQGGRTVLGNLGPVCEFHHLIVIHSWGWTLVLSAEGTTIATSPNGRRVLRSHSPPGRAA